MLSDRPKLLFDYFKQLFAQVTNPPIDPLREGLVMSLMSFTGKQRNLLDETPEHCRQLKLPHPILTNEDMERLRTAERDDFKVVDAAGGVFGGRSPTRPGRLRKALDELVDAAERAIAEGASLLILSDRDVSPKQAADPQPAGHGRLAPRPVAAAAAEPGGHRGRKRRAARGDALLPAVRLRGQRRQSVPGLRGHPKAARRRRSARRDVAVDQLTDQYITAVKKGILKTISKMGISTLRSYHAAQQFEAVGLNRAVIDKYFTGTPSRIERLRPGRDRPRGARSGTAPASSRRRPARWNWTSAASTSSGSTAKSTSGTRRRSSSCSTRWSKTIRSSTPSTPRRSTTRAAT